MKARDIHTHQEVDFSLWENPKERFMVESASFVTHALACLGTGDRREDKREVSFAGLRLAWMSGMIWKGRVVMRTGLGIF